MMDNVQKLGFGMMRLPQLDGAIDLAAACAMVDRFLEAGGLWFDTAWGYHGGQSEPAVRSAVVGRHPRARFRLATKLPVWLVKERADAERIFAQQLERTGAGYFDRYLLHALSRERLGQVEAQGLWDFAQSLKERGLVRSVGFSFHDTHDVLEEVLAKHPEAEFVQLQINYLDWEDECVQSRACYEVARSHRMPVVVMEPVKGGALAALPDQAARPLRARRPGWSDAQWALAFCQSLEGVGLTLSGMSDLAQMTQNLGTFAAFEPLDEADYAALRETAARLRSMPAIPCTACGYCVAGCPQHINIPEIFETATSVMRFGPQPGLIGQYQGLVAGGSGRASDCAACRACEANCPQHLEIARLMADCAALLEPR